MGVRRWLMAALVAVSGWAVTGCGASGPVFSTIESSLPPLSSGDGRIFFFRDGSILGAAVTPDIRLNDEVVGESRRSSVFFVDRPAGRYEASCQTEARNETWIDLASGDTIYVRTFVTPGAFVGHVQVVMVSPESGRRDIQGLHYVGPPLTGPSP